MFVGFVKTEQPMPFSRESVGARNPRVLTWLTAMHQDVIAILLSPARE